MFGFVVSSPGPKDRMAGSRCETWKKFCAPIYIKMAGGTWITSVCESKPSSGQIFRVQLSIDVHGGLRAFGRRNHDILSIFASVSSNEDTVTTASLISSDPYCAFRMSECSRSKPAGPIAEHFRC